MKQNPEITRLPNKLIPFIWHYLKNKKLYLVGFFIVALVWAIEMSLSPYLLKVIIDAFVQYSQNQAKLVTAILIPAALYATMSIILNVTFRLYDYINLRLNPEIMAAVNMDMFSYLIHHSHAFFQNNFAGSLTRKIFDMTNIVQLIGIFNEFFYPRIFAMLISSITLFIVVKPIFGIILFTWAIMFIIFSYGSAKKSEKQARQLSEVSAKLGGTMSDSVTNVMSTKLFSNIPNEIAASTIVSPTASCGSHQIPPFLGRS